MSHGTFENLQATSHHQMFLGRDAPIRHRFVYGTNLSLHSEARHDCSTEHCDVHRSVLSLSLSDATSSAQQPDSSSVWDSEIFFHLLYFCFVKLLTSKRTDSDAVTTVTIQTGQFRAVMCGHNKSDLITCKWQCGRSEVKKSDLRNKTDLSVQSRS